MLSKATRCTSWFQHLLASSSPPQPLPYPAAVESGNEEIPNENPSNSETETTSDFLGTDEFDSSLRGNYKWAPPRPQLILKIHEKRK